MHKLPKQLLPSDKETSVYVEYVVESKAKYLGLINKLKNSKLFYKVHTEEEFYCLYFRIVAFSTESISKVKKSFSSARFV